MFCSPCSGFFTPAGGDSMAPCACQAWQSNFSKSIFAPSHIFVCWANRQTKQNVQYLLPEQKINIIGVTFRCSQLTQCRQCSTDWQCEAMSPQQLDTCRQRPGPTVASQGLSADHTDTISVSSFFVIASLTSGHCSECLQWPVAAYCSTGLHNVGGDTRLTRGSWSPVVTGPDCSASVSITPLLPRPEKLTRIIDQADNSHSHPTFIQGFLINLKK